MQTTNIFCGVQGTCADKDARKFVRGRGNLKFTCTLLRVMLFLLWMLRGANAAHTKTKAEYLYPQNNHRGYKSII